MYQCGFLVDYNFTFPILLVALTMMTTLVDVNLGHKIICDLYCHFKVIKVKVMTRLLLAGQMTNYLLTKCVRLPELPQIFGKTRMIKQLQTLIKLLLRNGLIRVCIVYHLAGFYLNSQSSDLSAL